MFTFTEAQLDQIRDARDAGNEPGGNFAAAYRLVAQFAEGQDGVTGAVIAWFRASAVVNENSGGAYAEYIRGYTEFQIRQRGEFKPLV